MEKSKIETDELELELELLYSINRPSRSKWRHQNILLVSVNS
jgi:hypothetical protein